VRTELSYSVSGTHPCIYTRFPLHAPTEFYRRRTDIALESFAITIPLLEHHEVPSICPDSMNDSNPDTHIRDLLEKHPHVVTRWVATPNCSYGTPR
jgi:hypothetical protein